MFRFFHPDLATQLMWRRVLDQDPPSNKQTPDVGARRALPDFATRISTESDYSPSDPVGTPFLASADERPRGK